MTDTLTPPADLVALKRDFYTAEAAFAEYAATLPPAADIISGRADLSVERQAEWGGRQAELTLLALKIMGHPWLAEAPNRYEADAAASRVARAI